MTLPDRSPHKGPSSHLNEAFGAWWLTLNGIGILAFELFLECQGSDENRHVLALASSVLVLWLLAISKGAFPAVVKKLRKSSAADDRALEREIIRDYLGVIRTPILYFPYLLGVVCLGTLAAWPLTTSTFRLLLPSFLR